jgi:hypothetical protein
VLRRDVKDCFDCLNENSAKGTQKLSRIEPGRFACFCGKQLSSRSNLRRHEKIHAGIRYQCTCCDETFSQSSKAKDHMKRHSRQFTCFCGKRLSCLGHLRRHEQIHAGIKYQCCYCDKLYSRPDYAKNHLMREHEDMIQPATSVRPASRTSEEVKMGYRKLETGGVCTDDPALSNAVKTQMMAASKGETVKTVPYVRRARRKGPGLGIRIVKCESLQFVSDEKLALENSTSVDRDGQSNPVDALEVSGEGVFAECEIKPKAIESIECNVGQKRFKSSCGKYFTCGKLFATVDVLRRRIYSRHEGMCKSAFVV